jgi:hypothetical protein
MMEGWTKSRWMRGGRERRREVETEGIGAHGGEWGAYLPFTNLMRTCSHAPAQNPSNTIE